MLTYLYNTETEQRVGPIREGYFTVDGVRPELPYPIVEIEIVSISPPPYDSLTQTIDYREWLDLQKLQYIKGYVVRNLTQQEIDDMNKPTVEYIPESVTPRQFRLALLDYNIDPDYITNFIAQLPDPDEKKRISIIWEYANSIERNDPLIEQFAQLLNVDSDTVDNIFKTAITYE